AEMIGPMNVGNPQEFTILELATAVIELVGSRSKIEYGPKPEDDPKQRRPDISLAQKWLSWTAAPPPRPGFVKLGPHLEKLLENNLIKQQLMTGSNGGR